MFAALLLGQFPIAGVAAGMISSKPASATVFGKSALRSLRTAGTQSPRPKTSGQPARDQTYDPSG